MANTDAVAAFYNENVDMEDKRLDAGRLEYAVTLHYINTVISELESEQARKVLKIADIGCGTGRYAIQLASAGHELSICDISSGEISLANKKAADAGVELRASLVADACNLTQTSLYKEGYYDVGLCLGPFYHTLDVADRERVLQSMLTIVRPGGYVLAAFVTRNAHLRDIAVRDPTRLSNDSEFYSQYLKDGRYTRSVAGSMHHTTSKEIKEFLTSAAQGKSLGDVQFECEKVVSCEGFLGFQHAMSLSKLSDSEFQRWLDVVLATAEDETTLGSADHLLVVLRRTA